MTYAKKLFDMFPCNKCKHRWPNERNPDTEVGSGCDCLGCEYRPDLMNCFEEKEQE